jgi:hypothetical protein
MSRGYSSSPPFPDLVNLTMPVGGMFAASGTIIMSNEAP